MSGRVSQIENFNSEAEKGFIFSFGNIYLINVSLLLSMCDRTIYACKREGERERERGKDTDVCVCVFERENTSL
jgi:hypothetical protein